MADVILELGGGGRKERQERRDNAIAPLVMYICNASEWRALFVKFIM